MPRACITIAVLRATVQPRGLHDLFRRHAADLRSDIRRVAHRQLSCCFPVVRARIDEVLIDQVLFDQDVQHTVRKRDIGAGLQLQMQIALSRGRRFARIDNDPAPPLSRCCQRNLFRTGKVSAQFEPAISRTSAKRNIAPGIRRAIDAEGLVVSRRCRDHAEPPVVINVTRAQSSARKLAHQISLLGRQRRSGIDADRIFAVIRLQLFEFRDDEIERFIPGRAFENAVAFDQRIKQAIGMMNLQVSRDAFRTETAFINRKVVARLKANHVILLDEQIHAALHRAVRTVRRHDLVDHSVRAPAAIRRIMKMRTEGFDDLFEMFDFAHELTYSASYRSDGS